MLGTLFSIIGGHFDLLAHPALLFGLIAVVFGILLVIFQGAFVAFLTNRYVMIGLACAGALLAFVSMQHQNKDLHAQLATANQQTAVAKDQTQTTADGAASVTFKSLAQTKNVARAAKITQAIQAAPKGSAEDAALDAIAAEDAADAVPAK